jgi:hypothetical protein
VDHDDHDGCRFNDPGLFDDVKDGISFAKGKYMTEQIMKDDKRLRI